jgi:hypothetical protein
MLAVKPRDGFRTRLSFAAPIILSLIFGKSADAQAPAPPATQDIVVRAQQEQAIRDFVASMTDPDRSRQLGRWDREVCPLVVGIDPVQAAKMEARIGDIAATLGLKARARGCLTSMLNVVDDDASGVARSLVRRFPVTLRSDGQGMLNRFAATTRPVRWVSVTDPCGFGGCSLPNSRLRSAERPAFQAMIVVVDGRQISNVSLAELSDYVTFVALANPPFGKTSPSTSIMSLFDGQHAPSAGLSMTANDMAFLKGLYNSQTDGLGQSQRISISNSMRKAERPRD